MCQTLIQRPCERVTLEMASVFLAEFILTRERKGDNGLMLLLEQEERKKRERIREASGSKKRKGNLRDRTNVQFLTQCVF